MAESNILNNAARILKLVQTGTPADVALRESLVQTRLFTAPGERRGISRAVFTYYRWWRWLDQKSSHQKQLEAALALQDRYNLDNESIKAEALAALAVPDWLKAEMDWPETTKATAGSEVAGSEVAGSKVAGSEAAGSEVAVSEVAGSKVGAVIPNRPSAAAAAPRAVKDNGPHPTELGWLRQLQREPTLWIRAKAGTGSALAKKLGNCTPAPQSPDALHYSGLTDLYRTPEFQAGEFEIQDLASQMVSLACNPQPGETWWDACAGEGGKTMHLSDLMKNKGLLWASDRSKRRLEKLKERAARAQVFNFRTAPWEGGAHLPTKGKFNGILVDAPCSGVGTWQRNPHARWTTTPKDVQELAVVQLGLLHHAAGSLKPNGRLLYAVCTLTRAETTAVADAFTAAHPELEPVPVLERTPQLTLWPHELNANGMFIAAWKKR